MNSWTHMAGWVLIHFVWQGAMLAVAAALMLRACRHRSASVRYVVACGALAAMLAAVIVTATLIESPAPNVQAARASMRSDSDGRVDVLLPIEIHDGVAVVGPCRGQAGRAREPGVVCRLVVDRKHSNRLRAFGRRWHL